MRREDLFKQLSVESDSKLVMVVLDGVGGLLPGGKTELGIAKTPNLDRLAEKSECGLTYPVGIGITPGSGPAHISLFGYDPLVYQIGRGALEAMGVDEASENFCPGDVAIRGNFATLENGMITDRRAGRPATEQNQRIIQYLRAGIDEIDGVKVQLFPGEEHRFVIILKGKDLGDQVLDADPGEVGKPIQYAKAITEDPSNLRTAGILNKLIDRITEELGNQQSLSPVSTCLLRGVAAFPAIPSMEDIFKLKTAAIAPYPMYRGLARLVGMTILETGKKIEDQIDTLRQSINDHDFFFVHVKKTDSYGEDGNQKSKIEVIENFDRLLPGILDIKPDVLVVTGDHSTPCMMASHSWHPNPFLISSGLGRENPVKIEKFSEKNCALGVLGRFHALEVLPLMMAHGLRLKKYGA